MAYEKYRDEWEDDNEDKPLDAEFLNRLEKYLAEAGVQGASAYQVAVNNGFEGTESEWLASLNGADGSTPVITWNGTTIVIDGVEGPDLKGEPGEDGGDGTDAQPQFTQEQVTALLALINNGEGGSD